MKIQYHTTEESSLDVREGRPKLLKKKMLFPIRALSFIRYLTLY